MGYKILIIPSWYPTGEKNLNGSYFREQANFLRCNTDFKIDILYGHEKSYPFLSVLWVILKIFFLKKWPLQKFLKLSQENEFGFLIPNNRRIPEKVKVQLATRLYSKCFLEYISVHGKPDLIHAQSGMDAGIYANEIYRLYNIPFVIIEHQVFVFHYYSRYRSKLVLNAFKEAKKTAAVSFDERRQILMNQSNCNPLVIWNLVNESLYKIDLQKRNKIFTIITVLNSLEIKGYTTFLDAIKKLSNHTTDFKFIMIGKGGDEKALDYNSNAFIQKSKKLEIYQYGEFYPIVQRDEMPQFLNKAHVFVSPGIQEPHGIAAREALMCGIPVITTANGGVEDSITSETGRIVPVKDSIKLADVLLQIKNKKIFFDSHKCREMAIKQCGQSRFLDSITQFYLIE